MDTNTEEIEVAEEELPELSELSSEALVELESFLVEDFEARSGADEFSAEDTDDITELAEAIAAVRQELSSRLALDSARKDAIAKVAAGATATQAFREKTAEVVAEEPVVVEEAPAELAVEDEKKFDFSPVGIKGNVDKSDTVGEQVGPTVRASADVPGFAAGQKLATMTDVAKAFVARRPQIKGTDRGNEGNTYLVASIDYGQTDEGRYLTSDFNINEERINALLAPQALVASGGICAPATSLYDLSVLGADACRPTQDSLPVFRADRGSIRFLTPPVFNAAAGSVRVTTAAQDAAGYTTQTPAGTTAPKPCIKIACGAEVIATLDAVSRCLTFGNMGSRTYPEQVEAWLKLSIAAQAKVVEQYILDKIKAGSTAVTAISLGGYGATRSLLGQISAGIAAWRSRYRYCGNVTLRAVFPVWVKDLIRVDLANDSFDAHEWAVSDAEIANWFAVRGVNPTFYVDTPTTGITQLFAAQAAGALVEFPDVVQWALFAEGTWLMLEGGSIDLGLVRDSTLNSTNDYQVWSEEFIGIVNRGHESLWISSTVCPNGTGPASVAPYSCA